MDIKLSDNIYIKKEEIDQELWAWARRKLTIQNFKYTLLKKLGKSVWNTDPEFILYKLVDEYYVMPRGFLGQLIKQCKLLNISFNLIDERITLEEIDTSKFNTIKLRPYQEKAVEKISKFNFGILVAPPGSGKTVMGIELFKRHKQPCLIIVHRKELLFQWVDRLNEFFEIPIDEIGIVGSGKRNFKPLITIATIQTLYAMKDDLEKINKMFGMVIVDECHHIPANTFSVVIEKFSPFYMYGLTATPNRKYKDEELIFLRIGQIIDTVDPHFDNPFEKPKMDIIIRETKLELPFDYNEHNYEILLRVLVFDSQRNLMIVKDVLKELKNKKNIIILTERKDHVEVLKMYLENVCDVIAMTGDDSKNIRAKKLALVRKNKFDVLIATGQLMGEGVDISNLDCLFLVFPFSFEGKLVQYIGRIQRSKTKQIIYDYNDSHIDFLEKMFKKRFYYYNKL